MKYLILGFFLGLIGCNTATRDVTPQLDTLKKMLREGNDKHTAAIDAQSVDIVANTAALQEIADRIETLNGTVKEKIPSPPPTTPEAEPAADSTPPAVSPVEAPSGVVLLVNTTFGCEPCERMKADHAAGKLKGFDVEFLPPGESFEGQKTNPAIRYKTPLSKTGWAVRYGYGPTQLQWLRDNLLPQPVATAPVQTSHADLVAIHNQLHGGGNWTWPGDLATHLRTAHGYDSGTRGIPAYYGASQHVGSAGVFRSVSRWSPEGVRSRNSFRSSCPSGNCPR
jgi:hypothetical protein